MRLSIIIIAILTSIQIQAQNVSLGYWGELMTHPGVKAAVDFPLMESLHEKTILNKSIIRKHQWLVGGELGIYSHRGNHDGMILGVTSGYRYERVKKKEGKSQKIIRTDISFGAGYYRSFLAGTTYQIQNNGEIEVQNLGGSSSFMPSGSVSFSMNIPNKKDIPLFWYFKPSYYLNTNHNAGVNHKPFLELGFTYQF